MPAPTVQDMLRPGLALPFTLLVLFANDVLRVTFQPWKFIVLNLCQTVTVTGVETSPDLRHARVFVSVLGNERDRAVHDGEQVGELVPDGAGHRTEGGEALGAPQAQGPAA